MEESTSNICKICLQQIEENVQFNFLNNENRLLLQSKLLAFLPETALNATQNPIICNRCTITVDGIHEFKQLCLPTESIIKDLNKQQKPFEDVLNYIKKEDTVHKTIKEELIEDTVIDELQVVDDNCLQVNMDLPVCIEAPIFYCYSCDYNTNIKRNLAQHVHTHRSQLHQCNICNYKCTTRCSCTVHMKSHTSEKPYKTAYQGNQLSCHKRSNFRRHSNVQNYKCGECDYSSNNKHNLKSHVIHMHTTKKKIVKNHKCGQCEYSTNYTTGLVAHIRLHTGEKPFKCNICDYRSNHNSNLKVHLTTHSNEKFFKCKLCSYACNLRRRMKKHQQQHLYKSVINCDKCSFKTLRNCDLKKHQLIHRS